MLFNKLRAIEYMRRFSLDALIATSPTNVTYFSNYHSWGDYLLKPRVFKRLIKASVAVGLDCALVTY